jgi:tetratricopeptide (TPR) repeat protein
VCAWHKRLKRLRDFLGGLLVTFVVGFLTALVGHDYRTDWREIWDQYTSVLIAGIVGLGLLFLLTVVLAKITRRRCAVQEEIARQHRLQGEFRVFKPATELLPEDLDFRIPTLGDPRKLLNRPYDPEYIPRRLIPRDSHTSSASASSYTEQTLREALREQGATAKTGFVLLGQPTEGKTRTLFEIVRGMDGYMVLRLRQDTNPTDDAIALVRKKKVILVLDNLQELSASSVNLLQLWGHLKEVAAGQVLIAATCRDGPELAQVAQSTSNPSLTELYEGISLQLGFQPVSPEEKEQLDRSLDPSRDRSEIPPGEAPTLGFIALADAIQAMSMRYKALQKWEEKAALQAMKLLVAAGVEPISHERLQAVLRDIFKCGEPALGPLLADLAELDFVRHPSTQDPSQPEMAYLRYAVPYSEGKQEKDDFASLQTVLVQLRDAEGLFYLGVALAALQRYEEALAAFNRAIALRPVDPGAWNNKGVALAALQRYEEALAAFNRAIELRPVDPEAWNNKGAALAHLQRYEEALAAFNRAIELRSDDPEAWANKGVALAALQRHEEALAAYDRAIALRPDYPDAWYNKGNALAALQRYEEALAAFNRAIALRPDYPEAWVNKGNALAALQRYEEALAAFNRAIALRPDYPEAWVNKGVALNALQRHEDALAALNRALQLRPDYPNASEVKRIVLTELERRAKSV